MVFAAFCCVLLVYFDWLVVTCFVICCLALACGGLVLRLRVSGWSAVVSVFSLCFLVSVWVGVVACVYTWVLLCGLVSHGFDLLVGLGLLIVVGKWCWFL